MLQFLKPNTDEVAAKDVDGEAVLINLTNGMYYSMDLVGGFIWSLIEGGHDLPAIAQAVAERYGIAGDVAREDVETLAQQLLDEKLALPGEGEASADPIKAGSAPDKYVAPELNKFDDMVDLFALDPPLPELSKLNG
ncbi:MAG: PqqD family protein [Alphaproteobacteria bacterium]